MENGLGGETVIDKVLNEAERYDFPIIIVSDGAVARNLAAKRVRSLSRVSPLTCLDKKAKEHVLLLGENSAVAVKTKRGAALVYCRYGLRIFMYLPMLGNVVNIPNEVYMLDESAVTLAELISSLASKLFGREMNASSFARVASLSSTLCFSEDVVKHELDGDGKIDTEKTFYAFGQALDDFDRRDATELSEPPVTVSFSVDTLTISLYGHALYTERTRVLAAVAPYSFTEKEYSAAFLLAVAAAIFKSRK